MQSPTVLIVGGTSGIGRALCELYCELGSKVGVIGRRENLLKELKDRYPDNIRTLCSDISDANFASVLDHFINELGGVDKLILTASIVHLNPELNFDKELDTIGVNVTGFVSVVNTAYHYFIKKGSGHLIAVTSIASARGNVHTPAYNASKAFQSTYLESLRLKAVQQNKKIAVTEIIPGYVDTDMAQGERIFWMASLLKAVKQIKKAIDNRASRVFVTKRWKLVYTAYKYMPRFLYTYLVNSKIKLQQKH